MHRHGKNKFILTDPWEQEALHTRQGRMEMTKVSQQAEWKAEHNPQRLLRFSWEGMGEAW